MPTPPKQRKVAIVGSRSVGERSLMRTLGSDEMPRAGSLSDVAGVGKSSLTVRFVEGHFVESYYPTIENTFSHTIKSRGQDFATEIVDTAGQVRAQRPSYQVYSKAASCSDRPAPADIEAAIAAWPCFRMNTRY